MSQSVEINGKVFVSVRQAAEYFGYSRDHITRLAKAKKILATRMGRLWFVDQTSLQNYFDDQKVEAEIRKTVLSKKRQHELKTRDALNLSNSQTDQLANKSVHVAFVCTCLLFALLFTAASQVVPASVGSLAALGSVSVDDQGSYEYATADMVQPVFTDDRRVIVGDPDRWVTSPEVTPEWVQVTP